MNDDIYYCLCKYLRTKTKLNLLSTSHRMHRLKRKIFFHDRVNYSSRLERVSFYDQFTNIFFESYDKWSFDSNDCFDNAHFPKNMSQLTFGDSFNDKLYCSIPDSVKRVTFGWGFDQSIGNLFGNSITHITFDSNFNTTIYKDDIPNTVTHLKFGTNFDKCIKDVIPNSVTHLKFGKYFNKSIIDAIPPSLIYVQFGELFFQPINDYLPKSVKHVYLNSNYPHCTDNISNKRCYSKISF